MRIETRPQLARAMRYDGTWEGARAITNWCEHATARCHSNAEVPEPVVEVRIGGEHLSRYPGGPTAHIGGELLRVEPGEWLIETDAGRWQVQSEAAFEHTYRPVHPLNAAAHSPSPREQLEDLAKDPAFLAQFESEIARMAARRVDEQQERLRGLDD